MTEEMAEEITPERREQLRNTVETWQEQRDESWWWAACSNLAASVPALLDALDAADATIARLRRLSESANDGFWIRSGVWIMREIDAVRQPWHVYRYLDPCAAPPKLKAVYLAADGLWGMSGDAARFDTAEEAFVAWEHAKERDG